MQSPLIEQLIEAFKVLPGVGKKTAQRMAYHLLADANKQGGVNLAEKLQAVIQTIQHCQLCQNYTEQEVCHICRDETRDSALVCVVESPTDLIVIENSGIFKGHYFVLLGHLSPIDGIGPDELGMDKLQDRLQQGLVKELILATNPTVEGEATAYYIQQMAQKLSIPVSRLAQGIPMGGELEYIDSGTLSQAFVARQKV